MSKKDKEHETLEEIMDELKEKVKDLPDPTPEQIEGMAKWMDLQLEMLSDMEEEIGMPAVMTILSRVVTTLAVMQGVSLERFQLGMALAYNFVKEVQDNKDNLTPSHFVH